MFYEFDCYHLDLEQRVLLRDGELIPLAPKALDLLLALIETEGRVASKEELLKRVWPDTFVEEGSLTQNISILRKTLGEGVGPQYIQTVSKRGYRFVAPLKAGNVTPKPQPLAPVLSSNQEATKGQIPAPRAVRLGWWGPAIAAGAAALVVITLVVNTGIMRKPSARSIRSLAVLPLENLSHDPDQDYFAEGMTEALINDLAKISSLRVISRTSVLRYRGAKKSVSEIARELNVDAVLVGTVMRDQDQFRITVELITTDPEMYLWAEKYEARLSGILSLQDQVAEAVAHAIQIKLTRQERSLLAMRQAVDPAAYEAYLRGHYLLEQAGDENLKRSRGYLEQAVAADPGYALAWADLAETYDYLASWGVLSSQDARPRARAAAQTALDLDNSLVGPLVTLAKIKINYEWDWTGAERLCKQAIALAPNYGEAHHAYATLLAEIGRTREAVVEARRAREVEPLSPVFRANVLWKLYLARQYDEAELESQKYGRFSGYILASVRLQTGRPSEAISDLKRAAAEWGHGGLELMYLAHGLGVAGAQAEGQQVLDEMLERARQSYLPPDYIAVAYEGLGNRDQALRWYEKAFAEHSINGWILPDPRLDSIRGEPRFRTLLGKMGLPRQISSDQISR